MSSGVTKPGLRITGISPVTSSTVDSIPTLELSPSMTASIIPSMSSSTSLAFVGLGFPLMLALGAAIGLPDARMSLLAVSLEGILIATVSSPPVVTDGTTAFLCKTKVMGPGQNSSISLAAVSLTSDASSSAASMVAMWTIIGLSLGRPFAR